MARHPYEKEPKGDPKEKRTTHMCAQKLQVLLLATEVGVYGFGEVPFSGLGFRVRI